MTELRYEVLVSDGVARNRSQRLPDGSPIVSSPLASTLIFGERDAVLVDPPFTRDQVQRVGDWVAHSGRRLAYIYATHGHGDHWFGTHLLMQRVPGAVAYATEGTIRLMHTQGSEGRKQLWDVDFPGLIPDSPVVYQAIPRDGFELEGHRMQAIETGHTDTDDTTVLHVPAIGLVVAGDVAYNGVHQYLLESGGGGIEAWLQAIDKVAALRPRAVVAGHKNKDLPDDPAILDETRAYLLDAQRLLADKPSPLEFYEQMLAGYPDRLNLGPLWYGARWDCSADPANPRLPKLVNEGTSVCGPGAMRFMETHADGDSLIPQALPACSRTPTGCRHTSGATKPPLGDPSPRASSSISSAHRLHNTGQGPHDRLIPAPRTSASS